MHNTHQPTLITTDSNQEGAQKDYYLVTGVTGVVLLWDRQAMYEL